MYKEEEEEGVEEEGLIVSQDLVFLINTKIYLEKTKYLNLLNSKI